MTFGILIPCYNVAAFLPELFAGIRAQSTPFDEIVCYDDASSDDTAAVAEALRARIVRGRENRGAAFARNRLIDATRSAWLHFHDADDLIDGEFLTRMMTDISPDVGAILCNIDGRDQATRQRIGFVDYSGLDVASDPVAYFLRHTGFATNGLYSRAWLNRIGGFREDLRGHEDPDLHIRLAAAGCKFKVVAQPLVTKLEHNDSYSARNRLQCAIDKMKCLESYFQILPAQHQPLIGREALATASAIYVSRSPERRMWMDRGITLASMCGVRGSACQTPFKDAVATVIGPRNVMRARRLRQRWVEMLSGGAA
jgi:glycosyltransferase involved in cell wall biosynthesis